MLCISCFSIFAFGNLTARAILKNICISLTKKRGLQLGDPAYLPGQRYTGPLSFWPRLALCHSLALSEECTLGHVDYFFFFGSGQSVESTHPRYWIQLIVCLIKSRGQTIKMNPQEFQTLERKHYLYKYLQLRARNEKTRELGNKRIKENSRTQIKTEIQNSVDV